MPVFILRNLARMMLVVLLLLVINTSESLARRSSQCSVEFSQIGRNCYFFSEKTANWNDAFYECIGRNSSLAILENINEVNSFNSYLRKHHRSLGDQPRWIGGKFDWKNNYFVWGESGKRISPILLSNQTIISSNKKYPPWTCITIDPIRIKNNWSPLSCFSLNTFVCQKKQRYRPKRRSFDITLCKRKGNQLNVRQKAKCLKLVGGYGGMMVPGGPAPIIQTPRPTSKNLKEYVCPRHMFVVKNRCYYFSNEKLDWNDAYWSCRDNKTYLAVIHSRVQDKLLGEFLNKGVVGNYERWIGGLYDWKQKKWLWANSGTPIKYKGFPFTNATGSQFEWQSITIDPALGFRWNSRLRTDTKHYICQKKAKTMVKLGDFNTVSEKEE